MTGSSSSIRLRLALGLVILTTLALASTGSAAAQATAIAPGAADDPPAIVVERHAIAVLRPDPVDRSYDVLELIVLRNDGDRTWLPRSDGPAGPMGLLRFSLPDGAADLRTGGRLGGQDIFFVDRGFATEMPVAPGRQEVTFAYRIRYGADAYVLTKTFPYPTGLLQVQLPAEIAGSAVGLAEAAPGEVAAGEGRAYRQLEARDVAPRATIALHLRNLPGAPPPILAEPVRWSALALVIAAAIAPAAYAIARGQPRGAAERRA
ncbi:MAG TPA: hypothetical protein VGL23_10155 [Chloroflexota bacterium]